MRKLLTISILALVAAFSIIYISCGNSDKTADAAGAKDSLDNVLARGKYLAVNVAGCIDCHSQRDFTKYSGPVVPGTEGMGGFVFDEKIGLPGKLYAKNITPDPETGIGTWTDDEILRALTQGINKNGDTLFPLMPYPHLNAAAKDDLMAIIAYIKTLKPIRNAVPARQLMMPIAMAYPGPMLKPSVDSNQRPSASDQVAYGAYMANLADCGTCHSPLTQQGPDMSRMYAGGYRFDLGSFVVNSANITPDSATGIGTWTEDQFMSKFTPYREEKNYNFAVGKENTIMPVSLYAGMTDADLKAIYAYLRTVQPISNKVEKWPAK
jgi:mono/diheme cytochrome c family protein